MMGMQITGLNSYNNYSSHIKRAKSAPKSVKREAIAQDTVELSGKSTKSDKLEERKLFLESIKLTYYII